MVFMVSIPRKIYLSFEQKENLTFQKIFELLLKDLKREIQQFQLDV